MLKLRKAGERGRADHGWLDSHHTFSFADYYDPAHMGFRALRVINDDTVAAGRGFGSHPHRDMEIISYVLEGALAHKDSMGTGSTIEPGDVQRMSAGTGVVHSEFNASKSQPVHFLQIWLLPRERGMQPGYEQKRFTAEDKAGKLRLVVSPDGRDGSITAHTEAEIYAGVFDRGQRAEHVIGGSRSVASDARHAWVHVATGKARVNGQDLNAGDGLALTDETTVAIEGIDHAEVLLFDLA
jgi:redox-sensitive bicupin YhaK (pirin superfamily)